MGILPESRTPAHRAASAGTRGSAMSGRPAARSVARGNTDVGASRRYGSGNPSVKEHPMTGVKHRYPLDAVAFAGIGVTVGTLGYSENNGR